MSRFLPQDAQTVDVCRHQAPPGAIQIEPGLWSHGRDLYIFDEEFVGDRARFVLAGVFAVLKMKAGIAPDEFKELLATALGLAAMARYETAFPEDDVRGGGVYVCTHPAPEGVTR